MQLEKEDALRKEREEEEERKAIVAVLVSELRRRRVDRVMEAVTPEFCKLHGISISNLIGVAQLIEQRTQERPDNISP